MCLIKKDADFLYNLQYIRNISRWCFIQAAIPKYHILGNLNNRSAFLCSGGWEVQNQDASPFSFWWELSSQLAKSCFLILSFSSDKPTNSAMRAPPLWPSLTLITSQSPISRYHHTGGSTHEHSVHNTYLDNIKQRVIF